MADGRSGYNPYAPNRNNRNNGNNGNNNYGVYYGYPYYPFSYGWNPGWYGNGYGNYYNNYPNNGYSFGDGFNSNGGDYNNGSNTPAYVSGQQTQVQQTPVQQTTGQTTSVGTGGAIAAQAQIANAVDKSPALVSANSAVAQAQSVYNESRDRVLGTLRAQPAYQQALDRRHKAAQEVAAAKGGTASAPAAPNGQPSGSVVAAAEVKLDAGDEVTKMEAEGVAKDPASISAKARLDQATADRDALKAQLMSQFQQSTRGG